MQIVVCDDHKIIAKELHSLLNQFNNNNTLKHDLIYFPKPSMLYEYMQESSIDVIFMDLDFADTSEDGIEWSKKILTTFPKTIIVILTSYEKRYKEGFEARVFRFMTKPVIEQEFFDILYDCMKELKLTETVCLLKRGIPQEIPVRDICYLSAQSGGSELWTRTDMYYCEESLLQWENQLPDTLFFRCHSKYLVNLTLVTGFEKQVLLLASGEKLPVSRRKWKAFKIAYMKCDIQHP